MADKLSMTPKKKKRLPPRIRARSRGRVTATMDHIVEQLREAHPEKEYRFVVAPEHKPELGKVIHRKVQGYTPVDATKEDLDLPFAASGSEIRFGDTVLMETSKEWREEEEEFRAQQAEEDAQRSENAYHEAMERMEHETQGKVRSRGSIKSQVRDHEIKLPEKEE